MSIAKCRWRNEPVMLGRKWEGRSNRRIMIRAWPPCLPPGPTLPKGHAFPDKKKYTTIINNSARNLKPNQRVSTRFNGLAAIAAEKSTDQICKNKNLNSPLKVGPQSTSKCGHFGLQLRSALRCLLHFHKLHKAIPNQNIELSVTVPKARMLLITYQMEGLQCSASPKCWARRQSM